jgi:DUF971 family protein
MQGNLNDSNHPKRTNAAFTPTQINKYDDARFLIEWNDGRRYLLSFFEARFHCPCAACVDEKTGVRTLKREQVRPDIHPKGVSLVGRYAIQIQWSDQHGSGMLDFDSLRKLCERLGSTSD